MTTKRAVPPVYTELRLTIPAREALERAGNDVVLEPSNPGPPTYTVRLVKPPAGLVAVLAPMGAATGRYLAALRLDNEPEYPGEAEAAWWDRGAWVPCPKCGAAMIWHEAGYVPGYRLCLNGHECQLSNDGRTAEHVR